MKKIIYIVLVSFLAVSCVSEPVDGDGNGDDGKCLNFYLHNDFKGYKFVSRATPTRGVIPGDDTYNENVFDQDDIHIFFYDANTTGNPVILYPLPERLVIEEDSVNPGTYKVSIKLEPGSGDTFPAFDPNELLGHNVLLYVVVNSGKTRADFSSSVTDETVANSLSSVLATLLEADFNTVVSDAIVPQDKFVMDSYQEVYIAGWNNVATMELKRVAAKVEVGIYNATADGYTAVSAQVKLVNYLNKSALGKINVSELFFPDAGDYLSSDYIPIPELNSSDGTSSTISYAEPFYSYSSNWSENPDRAAFLLLEVMWYRSSSDPSTAQAYYYRIPIGYIPSDVGGGDIYRNKILRNHIYRYFANITGLGSSDPTNPTELEANLDIIGWDDQIVEMTVEKFDWLFVEQQNIILYPVPGESIQEYLIPYKSNSPLIFTYEPDATYEDYTGGQMSIASIAPVSYPNNPDDSLITQYPYIGLNYTIGTDRYIRVKTRTPINYVPKYISFRVENEALLYATVNITQYPALYVTSQISNGERPSSVAGGYLYPVGTTQLNHAPYTNDRLFTITTLAITGDEVFDWTAAVNEGISSTHYSIGDARDVSGTYINTAENAWVVSPKFVISSDYGTSSLQQGNSPVMNVTNAYNRCPAYWEHTYVNSEWRLPSMAELYLIYKLQIDPNSAVRGALITNQYKGGIWSIGSYWLTGSYFPAVGAIFNIDAGREAMLTGNGNNMVRCVYDIYRH